MPNREKAVNVREAQLADLPALDRLVAATLTDRLSDLLPADQLEACARDYRAHQTGDAWYVADDDTGLAGYAVVARADHGNVTQSACGDVKRLYVRGNGHGEDGEREIVAALLDVACADREVPLSKIVERRAAALDVYSRWGFVDVNAVRLCLSDPSGHGCVPQSDAI